MSSPTIDFSKYEAQAPAIDFSKYEQQPTSEPEKDKPIPILEGYQRAGRILKHAGSDIASSIGGMADMFSGSPVTGPLKLGQALTGRYMDAYKGAKDAAQRGDTTESMFKSVAFPFAPIGADEIYDDAKSGDNEKAAGKGISRILQVAGPEIAPHVLPAVGDMAGAVPKVGQTIKAISRPPLKMALEAAKDIPVVRGALKGAEAFKDVPGELRSIWAKPTPEVEAGTSVAEPAPAPYRMRGNQIQDATTVMPRRIQTDPARLLGEGTASGPVESEPETTITPLRATSPKAAQTEILRKAGVASPAATIKPMTRVPNADIAPRPDLKFSGSHSGEEAAMNQLTENVTPDRLGINELRGIAQQRGIKVSPGDNHVALYRKIQDSLTPEEIEQFEQARIERMQPDYSLPPIQRPVEPIEELPREAVSDEDRENLIMKSIQRAKSKKAGAN